MNTDSLDSIIITDLLANGIIGVKHPERDNPQDLLINITMYKDLSLVGETDEITDTINYATVSKFVIAEVARCAYKTVEALAGHLAALILEEHDVEAVRVRVEKPKKVSQTTRVGAEVLRKK